MIGEKIGEMTSKTTGRRVIPNDEHGPKMEISYEATGTLFGVATVDWGTYEAMVNDHGVLEGTGRGISMTKDGETITWHATGIGRFTGKGQGVQWRGSVHYRTSSQKLARINSTCCVYEYDIDETGNVGNGRVYEWK